MTEISRILNRLEQGEASASEELLPLVYEQLRKLANRKVADFKPGQTLQPTVLVHEAYLRLVDVAEPQQWNGRGHFYAAAAEAMRRILVERARRKKAVKHGGKMARVELNDLLQPATEDNGVDLLALDEALNELEAKWPEKAELVKLRYFVGLTVKEAAETMRISRATAERHWKFARAWLHSQLFN